MRCVLKQVLTVFAAGVLAAIGGGEAFAFSKIVVFGDSLSDNGNVYQLTQGYPGNPFLPFPGDSTYVGGRQTNGRVAVEFMSLHLNTPLADYAQAGATTGSVNVNDDGSLGVAAGTLGLAGMRTQVTSYLGPTPHPVDSNALYVLWGGPNDFFAGLKNPGAFDPAAAITAALGNLSFETQSLYGAGARDFLIPNMADLGLTPRARFIGLSTQATGLTMAFNANLNDLLAGLRAGLGGSTIYGFDSFAVSHQIFADLSGGNPDALNVSVPCSSLIACATDPAMQSQFFFWDDIHPTTQVASIFGGSLAQAVPEPETWALLLAGLALVAWMRRRIRA
jgi:phospholipase/lecithinase/hemolysin